MSDYTGKQSRQQGRSSAARAPEPSAGKRTLVEQAYPPVQQRPSAPGGAKAEVPSTARGVAAPVPSQGDRLRALFGRRDIGSTDPAPHLLGSASAPAGDAPAGGEAAVQRLSHGPAHEHVHAAAARGVESPATSLPFADQIQASFGARHEVGSIQAHLGGAATEAASAMGASAYATGNHTVFAGAPDLHTAAHEAAHVVQQRGGVQLKGGVGEAGDVYEHHADAVADRVVRGESAEDLLDGYATSTGVSGAGTGVQRFLMEPAGSGGPVTPGNRPDPSSTTNPVYVIHSSASRVMHIGDEVEYRIDQPQATVRAAGSHLGVRWQVINDPAAVQSAGIPATIDGPADQMRWGRLVARAPGVHTIKTWLSLDGRPLGELTYQQQVVSTSQGPVQVPTNATASPLATMRDFIALVRRIESAYGGRPWQDVVSRIRKEYYPGPGGGPYSGIKASFTWDDLVDEQEGLPGLEVPPVAMADVAAIRHNQVVTTDAGESIDIGHILTGVDSFNFPRVAGIFATHGTEGPAAATWSGDVGSALVNWAVDAPLQDTSDATKLRFYNSYASGSDMLGDVDALAVAHGPNLNLPPGAPLSQRLEAFYQTAPATGQHQRFHNFCRASHFNLAGNRLDPTARAHIRDQVVRFARAFNVKGSVTDGFILGGGGLGRPPPPAVYEATSGARIEREVGWFADHFVEWVNAGLAAEGTH